MCPACLVCLGRHPTLVLLSHAAPAGFSNALANVAKEIAVWKKLDHMHCVQLYEVIDDPEHDKLFLFGEFVDGGAIMPDKK